jgi:hypothetical protein
MQRILASLLAVAGPLLVLGGSYEVVNGWADAEEANANRNAGRILNSRVIDRGVVAAMELLLEQRQPEVLIIGPSYANTDVRPDLLATRLQVPRDKVLLLSVPNSVGAHWYAVLKHRVFANGHRPKLVVVVSGLQSMLLTTPLTESSFVNLRVHLGDTTDPEIDARVRQTASMRMARLREQRGKVRASLFDVLRFAPVSRLFGGRAGGPMTAAETREALGQVFDDANVDMALHGASSPIVEANRIDERAYTPEMLPSPDDSFLGPITALVAEHGGRTVWVRPPMSPHAPAHLDDIVLPGVQEQTMAMLAEKGGDFVDMRGLPMTSDMFKNEDHMNEEGSRRFSEALARTLQELDALEPKARPGLLPPLQPTVTVEGEGTEQQLADGLVPPGTTVRWSSSEGWDPMRGTFALGLAARLADATSARPVWEVAGQPLTSVAAHGDGEGLRLVADERLARPDGPFEVVLTVPDDGSELSVAGLALGRRKGRSFLIGDAVDLDGHTAELFGAHRVDGGVLEDHTVRPTYARKPVKVPGHDREVLDLPGGRLAAFRTERWAFLSDEALIGETNFGSRCSPLRITEDGDTMPLANVPCVEVKRSGQGRSCHTTDRIFFSATDDTDPATNGRDYKLVLDEGRLCDGAVWLYPKDRFTVAWPSDRLAGFREGARYLTVGARYLNQRAAEITVRLLVDGQVRVEETLDGRELKKGPRTFPLDPPLSVDAADVTLQIDNEAHVFYLVDEATLSERPPAPR